MKRINGKKLQAELKTTSFILICFIVTWLAILNLPAAAENPTDILPSGIHITAYFKDGYRDPDVMDSILEKVESMKMVPVFLWTTYYNPAETLPPHPVMVDPARTPDMQSLNPIFNKLREKNIPIALAAYIDPQNETWRAIHEIDIDSYRKVLLKELNKLDGPVDFIQLSSELTNTEGQQNSAWETLISELRILFPKTRIMYAMDRNSPVLHASETPDWMKSLDFLGVTLYHGGTTLVEIIEKSKSTIDSLVELNLTTQTAGFIGEIGYSPDSGSMAEPWRTLTECDGNDDIQLLLYKNILPWLVQEIELPVYLWRIEPSNWDGPCDFSPLSKKTEAFLVETMGAVRKSTVETEAKNTTIILYNSQRCLAHCKTNCTYFYSCRSNCVNQVRRKMLELQIEKAVQITIFGKASTHADSCFALPKISAVYRTDTNQTLEKSVDLECRGSQQDYRIEFSFEQPTHGSLEISSQVGDWCIGIGSITIEAVIKQN
ncbi:MAG: hypothetical protein HQK65_14025 [Desulfamplus sp.]|nr:hypothetical protein [Desulfamplus sp.]